MLLMRVAVHMLGLKAEGLREEPCCDHLLCNLCKGKARGEERSCQEKSDERKWHLRRKQSIY